MSFNVLAQNLLEQNPNLYRRHNPAYLGWEQRWRGIQGEIAHHQPDIVCLQVSGHATTQSTLTGSNVGAAFRPRCDLTA
jgi:mRNA deadenylase 3'-5' endonuclease subunit Ccr4